MTAPDSRRRSDNSGEWDMHVGRGGQEFALPFTQLHTDLAPLTKTAPNWHREGDKPRQLQPFEEELVKIVHAVLRRARIRPSARTLMSQYNKIFTENIYNIGVFVGRYGLARRQAVQERSARPARLPVPVGRKTPSCPSRCGRLSTSSHSRCGRTPSRCTRSSVGWRGGPRCPPRVNRRRGEPCARPV